MDTVPEGSTSYHDYSILDADGVAPTLLTSLSYKLSSSTAIIKDWTAISPPETAGIIEISYTENTMSSSTDLNRYITLKAVHGTNRQITGEKQYRLIPSVGITPT